MRHNETNKSTTAENSTVVQTESPFASPISHPSRSAPQAFFLGNRGART